MMKFMPTIAKVSGVGLLYIGLVLPLSGAYLQPIYHPFSARTTQVQSPSYDLGLGSAWHQGGAPKFNYSGIASGQLMPGAGEDLQLVELINQMLEQNPTAAGDESENAPLVLPLAPKEDNEK